MRVRRRVFEIVEAARPGDRASKVFDLAIIGLIVLNVAAMIAESMPECAARWPGFFMAFERVSIGVFIVEYVLRLWSCVESDRFSKPLLGRLRFARTPMAIVDFFAIAPGLLPFVGLDLRVVRMLRAFRLLRIAKLSRYTRAARPHRTNAHIEERSADHHGAVHGDAHTHLIDADVLCGA